MGRKLTEEEKLRREKLVVELYSSGMRQADVAKTAKIDYAQIKPIVIKYGVYQENRHIKKVEDLSIPYEKISRESEEETKRMKDAFRPQYVHALRKVVKEGDIIRVKTDKASYYGMDKGGIRNGAIRRARVINNKGNRFLTVEILDSGVRTQILWSDLYMAHKDKKKYVE